VNEILMRENLAENVVRMRVRAPVIAKKRRAGQFIILRTFAEKSERIPLTIADADPEEGSITLVFQVVGKSTAELADLKKGDHIHDLVGPLGKPTHVEKFGHVICIGGGIGIAPLHPIAQAMKAAGNNVTSILGARTKELLIMEDELKKASSDIWIVTDDGSYGKQGFVTNALEELISPSLLPLSRPSTKTLAGKQGRGNNEAPQAGQHGFPDLVVAIGPAIMMKMVCKVTKPQDIPTVVSLNTIMVDGTGMCGSCRVSVDDRMRFVCVDGPEFDGHKVDFDEMMKRQATYVPQEKISYDKYKSKGCCGNCKCEK
jgi:ferredoxin--NADP+ reductase